MTLSITMIVFGSPLITLKKKSMRKFDFLVISVRLKKKNFSDSVIPVP